jgi:serine/threonine protein kinase
VPHLSPNNQAGHRHPWQAFQVNVELWQRGLPVPEPLAFVETTGEPSQGRWMAITRYVPDCQPILEVAFDYCCRQEGLRHRFEDRARAVLDVVLELHRSGYAHGDLHHSNVLVGSPQSGSGWKVVLTDFDLCERVEPTGGMRLQLLDLARLGASLCLVVPESLLRSLLSYYFDGLGLSKRLRRRYGTVVAEAYGAIKERLLECFYTVEACCLAQAERELLRRENAVRAATRPSPPS